MKGKKKRNVLIVVIAGILSVILALGGYNFYRFPAALSQLSNTINIEAIDTEGGDATMETPEKIQSAGYVINAHGLGGSYRSNLAYAEQAELPNI